MKSHKSLFAAEPLSKHDTVANSNNVDGRHRFRRRDDHNEGTFEETHRFVHYDSSFSIPEVNVDSFVNHLLPPLKSGFNIEDVMPFLRREALLTIDGRWRQFMTSPAESDSDEDSVFAPLADIFGKSTYYASRTAGLEPTFVLSLLRNSASRLYEAGSTRPDGYFILKEAEDRARQATERRDKARWWYDIALTVECKKGRSVKDLENNVSNLVFNVQQIMALDPCRRFTFGITVENTSMRLWFFSRETAVVSKEFNFTTEANLLTRVLLSFAFASKEELGWDLTIRPFIRNDGKRQYRIDVGNSTYETQDILSDSADALFNRATRVWKVALVDSEEQLTLKDVWVEDDRPLEHDIYYSILHDVERRYGPDVRQEAASHLITPVAFGFVTVNGEEDHTTRVVMRGYAPSLENKFKIRVKEMTDVADISRSGSVAASIAGDYKRDLRPPFPRHFRLRKPVRRKHYRIVFREVADVLYSVKTLSDVFIVLRDSAKVLGWIHGSGWVHRDISAGNLYFFNGRGLISDFEYAKRKGTGSALEKRVGTPDFIASEAAYRCFLYLPKATTEEVEAEISALLEGKFSTIKAQQAEKAPPPFFHNDLHDLESLWWIAVWQLFFYRDSAELETEAGQNVEQDRRRDSLIFKLFAATGETQDRRCFFENRANFEENVSWMSEKFEDINFALDVLRVSLLVKYRKFEACLPEINMRVLKGTHGRSQEIFEVCRRFAGGMQLAAYSPYETTDLRGRRSIEQVSGDPPVPSLERDEESGSSEASFYDLDLGAEESAPLVDVDINTTGCSAGNWRMFTEDFLTPVPSLYTSRYELEVC